MTFLIQDLLHFEEVEEVIKLRKDEQAQEIVEKYVISEGLRRNLLYMFELLSGLTDKSFNIVGNYGTGKSHFLAFVAALLEHPALRSRISDAEVRVKAETMPRRYRVVKFELGAAAEVSLRHIFFDQVYQQLLQNYDIEVKSLVQNYFADKPKAEIALAEYESDSATWEKPLQKSLVETGADKDEAVIRQAQQIMKLVQPQQASQGKYNVQIGQGKGIVIGDNAQVTQTFGDD